MQWVCCAVGACATLALAGAAQAVTVYSQNFEPPSVTTSSASAGPGGFVQATNNAGGSFWQVQGGGSNAGVSVTAGIDTNGVGGSQALFANWDHTPAAGTGQFTFNQYTVYGRPAIGAGTTANQVQISLDLFMSGSETSNTPLQVIYQQNGTLDMAFTPTLANDTFTHVVFTLDQATNSGSFDPTLGFNFRVNHGAGGFGFDANNIVRVDNILIATVVPEPASIAGFAVGALGLMSRRRRAM